MTLFLSVGLFNIEVQGRVAGQGGKPGVGIALVVAGQVPGPAVGFRRIAERPQGAAGVGCPLRVRSLSSRTGMSLLRIASSTLVTVMSRTRPFRPIGLKGVSSVCNPAVK